MRRFALFLVVATVVACERPDPKCATSDGCAAGEFCRYDRAYGFLEDGNPSPFDSDRYACESLPAHCSVSTCECLSCAGDFACDAGPDCACGLGTFCTDGEHGAIVTSPHE
jgi:hypothetical protein